jgi:hypothetical protein
VHKALELEAISHGATNLIVGVTKSTFGYVIIKIFFHETI